jgi:hypothetical protein
VTGGGVSVRWRNVWEFSGVLSRTLHGVRGNLLLIVRAEYREVMIMRECKSCKSTDLVYSGVDAFILGVPTETFCYPCANQQAREKAIIC